MKFNLWMTIIGALLIGVVLLGSVLKRLPLTTSIVYLAVGFALGPAVGFGLIGVDPLTSSATLERLTEIAVIVSLFTAGLKFRAPLRSDLWNAPLRLASVSMTVTVALIAAVGVFLMNLPLGVAVLLGAVLAPTDPVLASDVQTEHAWDRDRLRFGLTGEAGLNDGTAFPFVMLGLGLLGLHDLGAYGWRFFAVDVLWAIAGGLAIGAAGGMLIGHFVLYLRRQHREAVGLDDFLALGLVALCYGVALLSHTYGFLAVFAAGVALRRVERRATQKSGGGDDRKDEAEDDVPQAVKDASTTGGVTKEAREEAATGHTQAPVFMAQAVLEFNEQMERIAELTVVVLLGGMLTATYLSREALWFVPLLFLLIRPLAVWLGLLGSPLSRPQRALTAWFGIRGVGSIYYLMYAVEHGLARDQAQRLTSLTLTVIAASILIHGISVTPLMNYYERRHSD